MRRGNTAQSIPIGPIMDTAGDPVTTAIPVGGVQLSTDGGVTYTGAAAGASHVANGMFNLPLTAGEAAVGTVDAQAHPTGALPWTRSYFFAHPDYLDAVTGVKRQVTDASSMAQTGQVYDVVVVISDRAGARVTGLTTANCVCTISKDGAAFVASTGALSGALADGSYRFSATVADMSASQRTRLLFTPTDTNIPPYEVVVAMRP